MGATASRKWRVAALVAAAPALAGALVLFAGCGGCGSDTQPPYPPGLAFPSRTHRLVLKVPDKPAAKENVATDREAEIAALDALGGTTVDPATIPADVRAALDAYLKDAFGTPADPPDLHAPLKLTRAHLAEGAKLFKRHCLQCHNLTGDGRGQGATTVPYPRDYRQGVFKFTTSGTMKPRRVDLLRTLHNGLKGTAMPAFSLLQEGERDLLAGYVTFLSVRGQVEFDSLRALAEGKPNDPAARKAAILAEWDKAEAAPPLPAEPDDGEPGSPAFEAAVRRGHALFTAKTGGGSGEPMGGSPDKRENSCISCHGEYGRKPVLRFDAWGTVAKPANLVEPHLKGGARPQDVYARVRFGIPAVGMPGHAPPKYTDRDVWDLVRFVTAAPYPKNLPPDVRAAVYGN